MDTSYAPLDDPNSVNSPHKDAEKTGTIQGSVFNLANTILGSGCLAMSYACLNSGIFFFLLLVAGTGLAAHHAVIVLFKAVEVVERQGLVPAHVELAYPSMGQALFGRTGMLVASWSVTLQQLGACVAYVVIVADVLQPILGLSGLEGFCHRWVIQLLVFYLVVFPLCLLRSMESLKYTSFAALFFISAFVFTILINGLATLADPDSRHDEPEDRIVCGESTLKDWTDPSDTVQWGPNGSDFLKAIPVICFAFLCHQNTFPIFQELPGANVAKMTVISKRAMSLCLIVYASAGLFGYFTFLDATDADLLQNFGVTGSTIDSVMDVVRVGFGFALIFSFPVVVWEARRNLEDLVFNGEAEDFNVRRHVGLNFGIVTIATILGIVAPGIESVLGLIGSTCSPLMMFILPGCFWLKAGPGAWSAPNKRVALGLTIYGSVLIPLTVGEWISGL